MRSETADFLAMSGHSKWATTFRHKSASDAKRGAIFTKLARAITVAARAGPNPETNFKLRLTVDQARSANMPKENIERAIQRGSRSPAEAGLEFISYEGFGPHGVAVVVEGVTDNRNRTGQEIRRLFESRGGRIGVPGSVSWQFERTGVVTVPQLSAEDELTVIDLGVTDVERDGGSVRLLCPPAQLAAVRQFFSRPGGTPAAQLTLRPKETRPLADEATAAEVQPWLEALADHPDVQAVYHNAAAPDADHARR